MKPTVFVCGACGKVGETRRTVGDESCYLHAVEVWRSSIVLEGDWPRSRVVRAMAATEPWVEPLYVAPPARPRILDASQLRARDRRLERRASRRGA